MWMYTKPKNYIVEIAEPFTYAYVCTYNTFTEYNNLII